MCTYVGTELAQISIFKSMFLVILGVKVSPMILLWFTYILKIRRSTFVHMNVLCMYYVCTYVYVLNSYRDIVSEDIVLDMGSMLESTFLAIFANFRLKIDFFMKTNVTVIFSAQI
jgi:hypothetical protein